MSRLRPKAVLGDSVFQEDGLSLNLQTSTLTAQGQLHFDGLTLLRRDIMGPFRFVPRMECRHSVFSMDHLVNGRLRVNGEDYLFRNARGYIEGDQGRSFPKRYAWTQCCFDSGSLMLSVAEIPLWGIRFTGIISVVYLNGTEYRLATYSGAKAVKLQDGQITVRQGDLTLTAVLLEKHAFPLSAPVNGAMTRLIRENTSCRARYQFRKGAQTLLSLDTTRAAFEYEYP
jgi:hypothetical protein